MPNASNAAKNIFCIRLGGWVVFTSFAAIVLWKGVLPALQNPRGDFANYYTAARLVAENKPLATAYRDFVWFQKQIDRYGITHQLGGFIPHPPPTALIMLPLASFEPLTAKRWWIGFNVMLAMLAVVLIAKITKLHWLPTAIILLSTGIGLINNFLFGQMYLLVLTTIAGGIYLQQRSHSILGGIVLGLMIPVKYVGGFFILYYIWKKEWRLVFAASATCAAMAGLISLLQGVEIFRIFVAEVLPRHLQGEIQEPFAIQFQSWNSLLRRMFVASPSLNPQPPLESPLLFSFFKNWIAWFLLSVFAWIYRQTKFSDQRHQRLFEIGLIPLGVLLISPGSATYHFLLLSLSIAGFAKILLDLQQPRRAVVVSGFFLIINLPHYLQFKKFAVGWLTPIGYMRLWLLVLFFMTVCYCFYQAANWHWQFNAVRAHFLLALGITAIMLGLDWRRAAAKEHDAAQWVPLHEKEFDRHLGLLVKTPDIGRERLVFSYGELLDEDYAIFSMTRDGRVEGQWTPDTPQKFYEPDIAADDARVLMESIQNGRSEIWLSRGQGQTPEFLREGEKPRWFADGKRFAFLRNGKIGVANLTAAEPLWLKISADCDDLAISPVEDKLVIGGRRKKERDYILALVSVIPENIEMQVLLQSHEMIERPTFSPEATTVVFSWNHKGNRDLWAINTHTRELQRLTRDPAIDTAPVWDAANRRLLFVSDRGRGLEVGSIFSLPLPEELLQMKNLSNRLP